MSSLAVIFIYSISIIHHGIVQIIKKKFSGQQPLDSHRGQMWPYLIYLQNYTFRESHP